MLCLLKKELSINYKPGSHLLPGFAEHDNRYILANGSTYDIAVTTKIVHVIRNKK